MRNWCSETTEAFPLRQAPAISGKTRSCTLASFALHLKYYKVAEFNWMGQARVLRNFFAAAFEADHCADRLFAFGIESRGWICHAAMHKSNSRIHPAYDRQKWILHLKLAGV